MLLDKTQKIFFLLISVISFLLFFTTPQKASAIVVPTFDSAVSSQITISNNVLVALELTQGDAFVMQTAACLKDIGPGCIPTPASFDGLANIVLKGFLSSAINSVTDWVKNGFNGSPAFITDLKDHFEVLGLQYADAVFLAVGADMCNLFPVINIDIDLIVPGRFANEARCTLDNIEEGAEAFYNQFSKGKWISFETSIAKKNNPFGLFAKASKEAHRRVADGIAREKTQLAWGAGFLPFKDSNGKVRTPGAMIQSSLSSSMGFDLQKFALADEFDELIGALMSVVMQEALSSTGFI